MPFKVLAVCIQESPYSPHFGRYGRVSQSERHALKTPLQDLVWGSLHLCWRATPSPTFASLMLSAPKRIPIIQKQIRKPKASFPHHAPFSSSVLSELPPAQTLPLRCCLHPEVSHSALCKLRRPCRHKDTLGSCHLPQIS